MEAVTSDRSAPGGPLSSEKALRLKMRELVWRMEQVAAQLRSDDRALDDQTLARILDASDARALIDRGGHDE